MCYWENKISKSKWVTSWHHNANQLDYKLAIKQAKMSQANYNKQNEANQAPTN